eukprot:jgi/Tetstr1/425041/TSEL_015506.t1
MDDNVFWADEETEEQVGLGDGLADRAVWGNNESTKDIVQEDEDEDEDGGNEDEEDEEDENEGVEENNGGYWDVTFHEQAPREIITIATMEINKTEEQQKAAGGAALDAPRGGKTQVPKIRTAIAAEQIADTRLPFAVRPMPTAGQRPQRRM